MKNMNVVEELVNKIAEQADLDCYESEMLLHDIYNYRGDEWLHIIKENCDKATINEFIKLINRK